MITKSVYYGSSRERCLRLLALLYLLRQTSATLGCEGSTTDTQLCSSPLNLSQDAVVCPGMLLTFICTTNGSSSLGWISDHYIGAMGAEVFFTFRDMVGSEEISPNGASFANLTRVNASDLTMFMLESQLHIVVSDEYSSSQIICSNTGSGKNVTINFNVDLARTSIECRSRSSTTPQVIATTSAPTNEPFTLRDIMLKIVVPIIGGLLLIAVIVTVILFCCCCPCCPCHRSHNN